MRMLRTTNAQAMTKVIALWPTMRIEPWVMSVLEGSLRVAFARSAAERRR